jgi:hypothetical protein
MQTVRLERQKVPQKNFVPTQFPRKRKATIEALDGRSKCQPCFVDRHGHNEDAGAFAGAVAGRSYRGRRFTLPRSIPSSSSASSSARISQRESLPEWVAFDGRSVGNS